MRELEYPFDESFILSNKKKIKRTLKESLPENAVCVKIAILGGSTTNDIKNILELFLLDYGIKPLFYESEYNMYYQDSMYPNEVLDTFNPDIVYIHTTVKNITSFPKMTDLKEDVDSLLEKERQKFISMWERLASAYNCTIIQNNFDYPLYRLLGNKDASDYRGGINYVTRLNMEFYKYAQQHEKFYICDINYISADYGLKKWQEPFYWHMYKYALNVSAIPYLSFNIANIIKSLLGKNKKGFVCDLDNTLWGGIVGDDGVDKLEIGPEEPLGRVYSEFQEYLKAHKQLGLLLNVNSKNEMENAIAGLNHPDCVLKPEDFIVIKANWNPKNQNYLEIAKNLNLLPESLVFLDDNPVERHIVTEQIPGVRAPILDEAQNYIQTVDRSGFFEVTHLSTDDLKRNEMYKENAQRLQLEASFDNYHDFLVSLNMNAKIGPFEPLYISRISQLTNKSNQFNLTTKRYSQTDIEDISNDKKYISLYGKLEDKFGDNGLVSVVVGRTDESVCHVDLWLMSCRVLKRDMEYAMMDALVKKCVKCGISEIRGYYYPTSKNMMVKDFYSLMDFNKISEDEAGNSVWRYEVPTDITRYKNKNEVINLI